MANAFKGEVEFEVDGKKYLFVIGTYAQVVLENRTGVNWPIFFRRSADEWAAKDIFNLFIAGLARHHEDLGEKEVGDIMDALGRKGTQDLIAEAMRLSFPAEAPKSGSRPPKVAALR